jgi:hypothetical protein
VAYYLLAVDFILVSGWILVRAHSQESWPISRDHEHVIVLPSSAECRDERIDDDAYVVCRWTEDNTSTDKE